MSARRVVVIGGGYAGIRLARQLDEVTEVILVDRKEVFFHRIASLRGQRAERVDGGAVHLLSQPARSRAGRPSTR